MIVEEDLADHVDLNFGCPVPKVTRKGGGAALPWRHRLFDRHRARRRARSARRGAGDGEDAGGHRPRTTSPSARRACARRTPASRHVALHGRTALEYYGGQARLGRHRRAGRSCWTSRCSATATSGRARTPCAWCAQTGCAGVVVGRGCLGRPWLFADLAAAFAGAEQRVRPSLGEVAAMMRRHAQLLAEWIGEQRGVTEFRKHVAWYLKGFPVGGELRGALAPVVLAHRARRAARLAGPGRAVPGPQCWAARAGAPAAAARCRCPRAGWPPATRAACRPVPSSPTAGAEAPVASAATCPHRPARRATLDRLREERGWPESTWSVGAMSCCACWAAAGWPRSGSPPTSAWTASTWPSSGCTDSVPAAANPTPTWSGHGARRSQPPASATRTSSP